MERVEKQAARRRIGLVPALVGTEQRVDRAQHDGIGTVLRGAACKRADAAGIADRPATPAPQPVKLDRKPPQSRIGCGILNGEAFFRGDRERDRLLAELQLMVARLRDRAQGASSVAARRECYILRPAILEDEARHGLERTTRARSVRRPRQ